MAERSSSGPIQVPLPGLLGLLQLKNLGRNPYGMQDSVQPIIDLLPFYAQAQGVEVLTGNVAIAAVGGAGAAVPSGQVGEQEWWMLHAFSASLNGVLGAGQELSFGCMIEYGLSGGGGGIGVALGEQSRVFVDTEGAHAFAHLPLGYYLMPPASQLYVWASRVTGGPFNVNCRARYTVLPI